MCYGWRPAPVCVPRHGRCGTCTSLRPHRVLASCIRSTHARCSIKARRSGSTRTSTPTIRAAGSFARTFTGWPIAIVRFLTRAWRFIRSGGCSWWQRYQPTSSPGRRPSLICREWKRRSANAGTSIWVRWTRASLPPMPWCGRQFAEALKPGSDWRGLTRRASQNRGKRPALPPAIKIAPA